MGLHPIIRYLIIWPLAAILLLLLIVWLISPFVLLSQTNQAIEPLGYQLEENSYFRFNPFTQSLTANNVKLLQQGEAEPLAQIEHLLLDIDGFALFDQILKIQTIEIHHSVLQMAREGETVIIAGYPLTSNQEAEDTNDTADTDTSDVQWVVQLDSFTVRDFNTVLTDRLSSETRTHSFLLETFELKDIRADLTQQKGSANIVASLNDSKIMSELSIDLENNSGEIVLALDLQSVKPREFNYLISEFFPDPENDAFSGDISVSLNQRIKLLEDSSTEIAIENLSVNTRNINALTSGVQATLNKVDVSVSDANVRMKNGALENLSFSPSLKMESLHVSPQQSQSTLLSIDEIDVPAISINQSLEQALLTVIPSISVTSIVGSEPKPSSTEGDTQPGLFSSDSLQIDDLVINDSSARIELITLGRFLSNIPINEEKALSNLVLPFAQAEAESAEEQPNDLAETDLPETTEPEPKTFTVSINAIQLDQASTINVSDHSVTPHYEETVVLQSLALGALDTGLLDKNTPFSSAIQVGKYGKINLNGQAQLFSKKLNLDLNSEINELDLAKISPYLRDSAGFDILSGHFDLNTQVKIVEDELDGESVLFLRGLDLETGKDIKRGNLSEQSFIPLNLALGALKDGDGNIEIDVDLSGNVNDPSVGLDGFIALIAQKAALSAAETYAINTFVPYANIVTLAKVAGSFALKVRVDDLIYPSQAVEVGETQQAFVANLGVLMTQKPDLSIKICPIATLEDLPPEQSQSASLDNPNTVKALRAIAELRGENLKATMIAEHNIPSARLLVCQARVDGQEEALPRIEFNI